MSSGSHARWLAPLALVTVLAAIGFIVTSSIGDVADDPPVTSQEGQGPAETGTQTTTGEDEAGDEPSTTGTTETTPEAEEETYTVQTGDTFGSIADETGVSVEELQELNPDVDPQSLTVGEEIRVSP